MGTRVKPPAAAPRRTQRRDAKQSRQALLDAAHELFAEQGPAALTVVAVAKRAGLNRSTAYQHFGSREDLLSACGAIFAGEVNALFHEPRAFGEQVDFFVRYFADHPDIARLWMFGLLAGQGAIAPGWGNYIASLEQLAASSKSQPDIDAEMLGVIGMASALIWSVMAAQRTDSKEDARVETERFATELKRLFLFGALRPDEWPDLVQEFQACVSTDHGRNTPSDSRDEA